MKLSGLRWQGIIAPLSAERRYFLGVAELQSPGCGLDPETLGLPRLEPRVGNVLGARLLELVLKEVPTPAAQCEGTDANDP
jgi:hypothetical protein